MAEESVEDRVASLEKAVKELQTKLAEIKLESGRPEKSEELLLELQRIERKMDVLEKHCDELERRVQKRRESH
ncbi:unnamed protein product [Gongylonema pulchrum]|uniref:Histidine kinase n=1 Tax=Gongylonema pulchrum TaxID=637853 RepID=A0A183DBX9_9BILA|nr:unnamed protein product [Gongylonema pulchrum]